MGGQRINLAVVIILTTAPCVGLAQPRIRPPAAVKSCLASHDGEPTVGDVRRAALRQAGVSRRDVRDALQGARLKGLLPRIRLLGLTTGQGHRQLTIETSYMHRHWPWRYLFITNGVADRPVAGGALSLDLRRLLVGHGYFKTLAVVRYRHALIHKITNIYFDRREAILRLCSLDLSSLEQARLRLRVQRLEALLNGLSGGRFLKKKSSSLKHPKGGAHASKKP